MYSTHLPLQWHPQESERRKSERAHRQWTLNEAARTVVRRRRTSTSGT